MRAEIALAAGHGLVLVERPPGGPALPHAVRFQSLRVRRAASRHRVPEHQHADYEVLLPLHGTYRCTVDGVACSAMPGQALVVRPGEHHADDSSGPIRLAAVAFRVEPPLAWGDGPRVVPLADAAALIEAWGSEPDDPLAGEIHDARCRALLLHLLRHAAPPAAPDDFAATLISNLERRLAQPLDLERLARDLHLSRRVLSERCRTHCQTSPARLMQELRLQRARVLLTETELPVKAVATRCGFANPNHFSTAFHRRFGHAPKTEGHPPEQKAALRQ